MAYLFINLKLLYQYEIDVGRITRTEVARPQARQNSSVAPCLNGRATGTLKERGPNSLFAPRSDGNVNKLLGSLARGDRLHSHSNKGAIETPWRPCRIDRMHSRPFERECNRDNPDRAV
jgi:hypothetical protein